MKAFIIFFIKNTQYNNLITPLVSPSRLGYVLIHRTPPYITRFESRNYIQLWIIEAVINIRSKALFVCYISLYIVGYRVDLDCRFILTLQHGPPSCEAPRQPTIYWSNFLYFQIETTQTDYKSWVPCPWVLLFRVKVGFVVGIPSLNPGKGWWTKHTPYCLCALMAEDHGINESYKYPLMKRVIIKLTLCIPC